MINKFIWILALMTLTSCATSTKSITYQPVFPDDWLGVWEGTLQIFSTTGKTMDVPMSCAHRRRNDGRYDWHLIYGKGAQKDERTYTLLPVNSATGHYQVDESNGILLDGFVFKDRFISTFEVMDNVIQTQYIRHKDGLDFEVTLHAKQTLHTSGDTIVGKDTIPAVATFRTLVFQKAILKRVE